MIDNGLAIKFLSKVMAQKRIPVSKYKPKVGDKVIYYERGKDPLRGYIGEIGYAHFYVWHKTSGRDGSRGDKAPKGYGGVSKSWAVHRNSTEDSIEVVVEEKKKKEVTKGKGVTFDSVILEEEKKKRILSALSQTENFKKIFEDWGFEDIFEKGTAISFIFYGVPGTGKTLMAEAIANHVKQDLLIVSSADIESNVPGQAERNIRSFFEIASGKKDKASLSVNPNPFAELEDKDEDEGEKGKKHVILFDECDSLIANRNRVGMIVAAQINTILTELERFEGIAIFTTNRLGEMDPAMERRITEKVDFGFPNKEARHKIWQRMIPKKCPISKDVDFEELADFPLAGGNIKNVVLNAARMAAFKGLPHLNYELFYEAIENEARGIQSWQKEMKKGNSFRESRESGSEIGSSNVRRIVKDKKDIG